jgi:hypothetical protein
LCADKILAAALDLRRRFDARSVQLMQRGVLSSGSAGLTWHYSFAEGLRPIVRIEPSWLLIP